MPRPVITLLTDFGSRDAFVGICKGVILGIAPDAQIVDLTHEIRPFRIRDGAVILRRAVPTLPVGTHVGVVDPGVGTARRPIAIRAARGDTFVGPDNGLLVPAAEALGGIVAAYLLENPRYRLAGPSATFHGRDIFSPAAAHLAAGVPTEDLGPAVEPETLVRIPIPAAEIADGTLRATVVYVDTFGNVELEATREQIEAGLGRLSPGDRLRVDLPDGRSVELPWAVSFGGVAGGDALAYVDSYGYVSIAVNLGSAEETFGLHEDAPVGLRRA